MCQCLHSVNMGGRNYVTRTFAHKSMLDDTRYDRITLYLGDGPVVRNVL